MLRWFGEQGRRLPWRDDPSPYRVLVSEFMLQQTQVERVEPIFDRFVARFASFEILARAEPAEVVRAWKGLGYNSRAVRLHRLAQIVSESYGGRLPQREAELLALPGIGPYTAAAVLAFAYDRPAVAADTNVRRVVHRFTHGIEWPPRASARELDALAAQLATNTSSFAFNSALMDLGATICTARAPACERCPLAPTCAAAPVDRADLAQRARVHRPRRTPQERLPFEQTRRYLRGRIVDRLRTLAPNEQISLLHLHAELAAAAVERDLPDIEQAVVALALEGVVEWRDGELSLARTSQRRSNA